MYDAGSLYTWDEMDRIKEVGKLTGSDTAATVLAMVWGRHRLLDLRSSIEPVVRRLCADFAPPGGNTELSVVTIDELVIRRHLMQLEDER